LELVHDVLVIDAMGIWVAASSGYSMAFHRDSPIEQRERSWMSVIIHIVHIITADGRFFCLCIWTAIPNLYAVQTVTSKKAAKVLNTMTKDERILNVLLQVNTSGEESKSGLPPFTSSPPVDSELTELAQYIITQCDRLHLRGLMTIGSLAQSLSTSENQDFETLTKTRDELQSYLDANREVMQKIVDDRVKKQGRDEGRQNITWGEDERLLLSMGMSSDFEAALKAGSDIVRVGTGIFGERQKKGGTN
jgi:uncharacterized pyridoxal phosphate-containing UPF0001 family protein